MSVRTRNSKAPVKATLHHCSPLNLSPPFRYARYALAHCSHTTTIQTTWYPSRCCGIHRASISECPSPSRLPHTSAASGLRPTSHMGRFRDALNHNHRLFAPAVPITAVTFCSRCRWDPCLIRSTENQWTS